MDSIFNTISVKDMPNATISAIFSLLDTPAHLQSCPEDLCKGSLRVKILSEKVARRLGCEHVLYYALLKRFLKNVSNLYLDQLQLPFFLLFWKIFLSFFWLQFFRNVPKKLNTPHRGWYCSISFLPATPLYQSRLFWADMVPFKGPQPCTLLMKLQRN